MFDAMILRLVLEQRKRGFSQSVARSPASICGNDTSMNKPVSGDLAKATFDQLLSQRKCIDRINTRVDVLTERIETLAEAIKLLAGEIHGLAGRDDQQLRSLLVR